MKNTGKAKHIAGCPMAVNPFHQERFKNSFCAGNAGKALQISFLN